MEIFTLIEIAILIALLWKSGIIGIFIFACVAVFLWEKFKIVILLFVGVLSLFCFWILYNKIKNRNNEPKLPKELERLKHLEKVREWSRRNRC